jgi:hypothetical protein
LFLSLSIFYLLFSALRAAFAALLAAFLYYFNCFLDLKLLELVLKTFLTPYFLNGAAFLKNKII